MFYEDKIRNFVVISHVDHGKSTLADRFLEITKTVDQRKMYSQYLDQLELEREKGITIKMAPVRMIYQTANRDFVLNLIDTPGHSDFSYEVSRALAAVEGAILLVDVTQGIQAQTLVNFKAAQQAGLKIIGAVNKIDLNPFNLEQIIKDLASLIGCLPEEIHKISAKTGQGVEALLSDLVLKIPPPRFSSVDLKNEELKSKEDFFRALIFDSFYDDHKGVVASIRVLEGEIKTEEEIVLVAKDVLTKVKEVGYFVPQLKPVRSLKAGEIGYLATGIKDPQKIKIGDTILKNIDHLFKKNYRKFALAGYQEPKPVVFVSFYPEESGDYDLLKKSLEKLKLNDSALVFEPDQQEILGRGFKVGFLGRLHFEITAERLKRELKVNTIQSFPSVTYKVKTKKGFLEIVKPDDLPPNYEAIYERMVKLEILTPLIYFSNILGLQKKFRFKDIETEVIGERIKITALMPLVELINDFDDNLKSVSQGFASFSYELMDFEKVDVLKVDFLLAGKVIPGLSRFLPRETLMMEARKMVEKLKKFLPRQQFSQAIQARAEGRIIAREDIPALKKDVTGYLYGGDRTRKMKLWQKQKEGKKKLKSLAKVKIPVEVFKELLKK